MSEKRWYVIDDIELEMTEEEYKQHRAKAREAGTRQRWAKHMGLGKRSLHRDYSGLDWPSDVTRKVDAWVAKFLAGQVCGEGSQLTDLCGMGLLFDGPTGTGKTTLAKKICLDVVRRAPVDPPTAFAQNFGETISDRATVRPVYFTRFDKLLDIHKALMNVREMDDEGPVDEFQQVVQGITGRVPKYAISLLVIDDAGKEYATDWTSSVFENLVRNRLEEGLATIVTTNVSRQQWGEVYGPSVARFAREAFVHVPIMIPTGDRGRA